MVIFLCAAAAVAVSAEDLFHLEDLEIETQSLENIIEKRAENGRDQSAIYGSNGPNDR